MRILLDTHYLLWWLLDSPQLGEGRALIAAPQNLVFLSVASLWELRIKQALGKITLPEDFSEALARESFEALSVTWKHTDALIGLPLHHRDPFDRMLLAQAAVENLMILTRDRVFALYDVSTRVV